MTTTFVPRWKKRSDLGQVFIPGVGNLRDGRVLTGEEWRKFYPTLLEVAPEDITFSVDVPTPVVEPTPVVVPPKPEGLQNESVKADAVHVIADEVELQTPHSEKKKQKGKK